ncbi:MAG: hypothetical protein L0G23_04525 [Ruaniaceae bacterium]|nr:hypothetical protein [Ruaniaceae bacterium]
MTDEELEARLRAADPATTRHSDAVSERGLALLAELTAEAMGAASDTATVGHSPPEGQKTPTRGPVRVAQQGRRRSFAPLLAAAAAAVVLVGVVLALGGSDDGYLQPPIVASAIDGAASDVMSDLSELAATGAGTGIGPDGDVIRVAQWNASGERESAVSVEESAADSHAGNVADEEESAAEVESAAEGGGPERVTGATAQSESVDAPESGGLTWTERTSMSSELPDDTSMIGPYLEDFTGIANPSAADYVAATRDLLTQNVLTAAQESALLGFLAQQDGLVVLGTTTDRAGREAAMFRADGDTDTSYLLLVSTTTGAILGVETVRAGTAVTDFTLWER